MEYFLQPVDGGGKELSRVYTELVHQKWASVVLLSHSEVAPKDGGEEKSSQGQTLEHYILLASFLEGKMA